MANKVVDKIKSIFKKPSDQKAVASIGYTAPIGPTRPTTSNPSTTLPSKPIPNSSSGSSGGRSSGENNNVFQGPVQQGTNEEVFRKTGTTISGGSSSNRNTIESQVRSSDDVNRNELTPFTGSTNGRTVTQRGLPILDTDEGTRARQEGVTRPFFVSQPAKADQAVEQGIVFAERSQFVQRNPFEGSSLGVTGRGVVTPSQFVNNEIIPFTETELKRKFQAEDEFKETVSQFQQSPETFIGREGVTTKTTTRNVGNTELTETSIELGQSFFENLPKQSAYAEFQSQYYDKETGSFTSAGLDLLRQSGQERFDKLPTLSKIDTRAKAIELGALQAGLGVVRFGEQAIQEFSTSGTIRRGETINAFKESKPSFLFRESTGLGRALETPLGKTGTAFKITGAVVAAGAGGSSARTTVRELGLARGTSEILLSTSPIRISKIQGTSSIKVTDKGLFVDGKRSYVDIVETSLVSGGGNRVTAIQAGKVSGTDISILTKQTGTKSASGVKLTGIAESEVTSSFVSPAGGDVRFGTSTFRTTTLFRSRGIDGEATRVRDILDSYAGKTINRGRVGSSAGRGDIADTLTRLRTQTTTLRGGDIQTSNVNIFDKQFVKGKVASTQTKITEDVFSFESGIPTFTGQDKSAFFGSQSRLSNILGRTTGSPQGVINTREFGFIREPSKARFNIITRGVGRRIREIDSDGLNIDGVKTSSSFINRGDIGGARLDGIKPSELLIPRVDSTSQPVANIPINKPSPFSNLRVGGQGNINIPKLSSTSNVQLSSASIESLRVSSIIPTTSTNQFSSFLPSVSTRVSSFTSQSNILVSSLSVQEPQRIISRVSSRSIILESEPPFTFKPLSGQDGLVFKEVNALREGVIPIQPSVSRSRGGTRVRQDITSVQIPAITQLNQQTTRQALRNQLRFVTTPSPTPFSSRFPFPRTPFIPIVTTPQAPQFGTGFGRGTRVRQPTGYNPSFSGVILGLRIPKAPRALSGFGGLNPFQIRGVITPTRRSRKKKRR